MPSLLLIVFALQLIIHLINTVGAPAINNLLWLLYNKLPTSTSQDVRSQTALRVQVVRLKRDMNATSSQDEFAKWAKLRRQHDKALAEYDQKTSTLQEFKSSFDNYVSIARWLATNGFRFFLQFWYAKQALFWVPRGWVPGYVEWMLAFPRAPRGSVSIQIWGIACATVVQLVGAAVVAGWVLVRERRAVGRGMGRERVVMGGRGNGPEKKEL
ncbi:GET complex subunit get1 [Toensbergia leucococca]|nr:GET complex subunit get1 [Toensbergia leucococca]